MFQKGSTLYKEYVCIGIPNKIHKLLSTYVLPSETSDAHVLTCCSRLLILLLNDSVECIYSNDMGMEIGMRMEITQGTQSHVNTHTQTHTHTHTHTMIKGVPTLPRHSGAQK